MKANAEVLACIVSKKNPYAPWTVGREMQRLHSETNQVESGLDTMRRMIWGTFEKIWSIGEIDKHRMEKDVVMEGEGSGVDGPHV